MSKIRLGIDVGGTFTHAVALDAISYKILSEAKVLTTHTSSLGVADGILQALKKIISQANLFLKDISFIAHSTTQATNALLEGDVAKVGIIAVGKKSESFLIKTQTKLSPFYGFLEINKGSASTLVGAPILEDILKHFKKENVNSIVVACPFSTDDPEPEDRVMEVLKRFDIPSVATHEVSGLYGLKPRTRTAVLNASILPKMMQVSDMLEHSIKKMNISASLAVMRSDGGSMTLPEMRKRPILSILSGPAAGIAGALIYEKVSDAIFVEVGGTSTDISCITSGRAKIKSAQVGGHNLHIKTLDICTVGVAGGSLVSVKNKKITDVGPRSAHILGWGYAAFTEPKELSKAVVGIENGYLCLTLPNGKKIGITPTCAANYLGLVKETDYALGNPDAIKIAFDKLAGYLGVTPQFIARRILEISSSKLKPAIESFIKSYELGKKDIILLGGGGGCAALVPYLAQKINMNYKLAQNHSIISALGVALAMLHEEIEKNIIDPSAQDILKVKQEAEDKLISMGAHPQTIEVDMQVDSQRHIVKASAFGSLELRESAGQMPSLSKEKIYEIVQKSMQKHIKSVKLIAQTNFYEVFGAEIVKKGFLGLGSHKEQVVRVVDKQGIIRLRFKNGLAAVFKNKDLLEGLEKTIKDNTQYGDAGELFCGFFLLYNAKILDLTKMENFSQARVLVETEMQKIDQNEDVVVLLERG